MWHHDSSNVGAGVGEVAPFHVVVDQRERAVVVLGGALALVQPPQQIRRYRPDPVAAGQRPVGHQRVEEWSTLSAAAGRVRGRAAARGRIGSMGSQRFTAVVAAAGRGKLWVPVPFDPDEVWGAKQRHHIAGTVKGIRVRAVIEPAGAGFAFALGRTSPARVGVDVGDEVAVEIARTLVSNR